MVTFQWETLGDAVPATHVPYHDGSDVERKGYRIAPERRPFIAWDGEGINRDGDGKPQSYVLFGASTGDCITSDTHLRTFEMLDFILRVGRDNPGAFHIGYSFGYDGNMIVRGLHPRTLLRLHKTGRVSLRWNGHRYVIQFLPNKWFSVSRKPLADKTDRNKVSVRIFDIFSFFTTSFITAYRKHVAEPPALVIEGKEARNTFVDIEYIHRYWAAEIACVQRLAEVLRDRMYSAGFRITSWHGPGALASYTFSTKGTINKKALCPPEVREAAKYGYAGGRFEMFKLGRTTGPIYSLDINSAYPHAIRYLPDLSTGSWERRDRRSLGNTKGTVDIARFGIYRVRLLARRDGSFLPKSPGPLFHRDKMGNISFPWVTEGWYWSPEVRAMANVLKPEHYELVDGWELLDATYNAFEWLPDMYHQRKQWKKEGVAAEYALKLCMNSLYGKMAQRVGWNEEKREAPRWHQLEWAGWVTSYTRASLWSVMSRIPRNELVAVETDGLYTTMSPSSLSIREGTGLGEWEVKEYDEILYVQSGMAWLRKGSEWVCKRRGLDAKTFGLDDCQEYLHSLLPNDEWKPFVGQTTRFIGLGAALHAKWGVNARHCVWSTVDREVRPGSGGKRIHVPSQCKACRTGASAYEQAHELSVRSLAYKDPTSHPHDIPWDNDSPPQWRIEQEIEKWLHT